MTVLRNLLALAVSVALLAGCDSGMSEQPKKKVYTPGNSALGPVEGTVPRETGAAPPPVTLALLQHGRERFDAYCSPCHGRLGDGQGMIVARGFPSPPSYHSDRLRRAPSRHFYDVITDGYGVMFSYGARIPPADRWAIVAYIRALQQSQDTQLSSLPQSEQGHFR